MRRAVAISKQQGKLDCTENITRKAERASTEPRNMALAIDSGDHKAATSSEINQYILPWKEKPTGELIY